MLWHHRDTRILKERFSLIEKQIAKLQQNFLDTLAMRASLQWRGDGEMSAALFKRIINCKAQQHIIPAIKHPVTGIPC